MVPGTRRRFAVMFTDIVGFTSMMERSEEEALRALEKQRSVLSSVIAKNSGTLIKEIGDGTLSVFESPSSAVRSARNIQSSLRSATFRVRIGIHWGEVLVADGDILGDTVNVASRLEALSPPGGICVSAELMECYSGRRPGAESLGIRRLRGLGRLIEIFALRGDSQGPLPVALDVDGERIGTALHEDGPPSILVATLVNIGAGSDDFYSFGLTADLITDLARAGSIRVTPMTSMLQHLAVSGTPEAAASRAGTRFLLKGSLLRNGEVFRLSVELHDTKRKCLAWLDSWEETWEELHSIKGKLADGTLKAMGVTPSAFPGITSSIGSTPSTYELYLKARYLWRTRSTRDDTDAVRGMLTEILASDPGFTGAHILLGETYRDSGEAEDGVRIFEEALERAQASRDSAAELRCRNALAISMWRASRTREARVAFVEVARKARRIGDREGEAKALNNLGLMDCELARYRSALRNLERSRMISLELGYKENVANALCNIGLVYLKKGRDSEALLHFEDSLELLIHLENRAGQANLLRNMGIVHTRSGSFDEALEIAGRSLEISRSVGDRGGEGRALICEGNSLYETGRYVEAGDRYRKALEIAHECGGLDLEGVVMTNLALLKPVRSETGEVLAMLERALEISRETGDEEGETEVLSLIGTPLFLLGRADEAIACLTRGLELSQRIGVDRYRAETRMGIVRILLDGKPSPGSVRSAREQLRAAAQEIPRQGRAKPRMLWGLCLAYTTLASKTPDREERSRLATLAADTLTKARRSLLSAAGKLHSEEARKSFLEDIPEHAAMIAAYRSIRGMQGRAGDILPVLEEFRSRS